MLSAIVYLLAFNAIVFAWLHFGRYVQWSRRKHIREVRRLR